MEHLLNKEITDLAWEHPMHNTYQEDCCECHKEDRVIQAHKIVNHPIDNLSAITGIKLSDLLGK
mgnify:CR=1 FL=1